MLKKMGKEISELGKIRKKEDNQITNKKEKEIKYAGIL